MKQEFSISWNGSRQPRKQRKYLANAPMHVKHELLSANLSKTLRTRYSKRNVPVRKGDSIKIMRGEFKGKIGKIDSVNMKKTKVSVEGITRTKKDGTKLSVYFHPSNLQIQELNLDDKKRKISVERKNKIKDKKIDNGAKENVPKKK